MTEIHAVRHQDLPAVFAPRQADTHKGSFGTLGILGGGPGMSGAALLCGRAALRMGAGKVFVGFAEDHLPLPCDVLQPELMFRTASALLAQAAQVTTWVAGCGLGDIWSSAERLQRLFDVRGGAPLVLDADGLNLLARGAVAPTWGPAPVVLTPHPAEAARLLGIPAKTVQADRPAAARALAAKFDAWVILKGAGTLVAEPNGPCTINHTGNPGLASAGTGDVLAGMIGALIAQSIPIAQAVRGGVYLHGAAADMLAQAGIGPMGLTASEVIDAARHIRNTKRA